MSVDGSSQFQSLMEEQDLGKFPLDARTLLCLVEDPAH